jgi:hypothetical protein
VLTLLPDGSVIKTLTSNADVISVLVEALRTCSEGKGKMQTKTDLSLEHGDFRGMPAGLPRCAGGKMVNVQSRETDFVCHLRRRKR